MRNKAYFLVPAAWFLTSLAALAANPEASKPAEDLNAGLFGPGDPQKMLRSYLQAQAQNCFNARKQVIESIKTPDDLKKRQQAMKAFFIKAIGGLPETNLGKERLLIKPGDFKLNPQITGTIDRDGYRIEKVIYESRPNHHVTANLYIPKKGKSPFPAVLVPCGHGITGKAHETYQRGCILLAKNGIVALCYDPIGQGERNQILDKTGKPVVFNTLEHTQLGIAALLVGQNTAAYMIWDGMRGLDYLCSRSDLVDKQRLGCLGNSGGGTLTSYLMALDDRIIAAAPSCYLTSLERLFATIGPQDAEQNITGQVAFGMDHADYITMNAPRPTLILSATRDFFDIQGTWDTFREAKRLYCMMDHADRINLLEVDNKHNFDKPSREAAVRWMRRWLLKKDDEIVEDNFPNYSVDSDDFHKLWCTTSGQVLTDKKGKSVPEMLRERDQELAGKRQAFMTNNPDRKVKFSVRTRFGWRTPPTQAWVKETGRIERDGYQIRKLAFETEPGITVPGLFFRPKGAKPSPVVLYVHGDGVREGDRWIPGKTIDARPGGPIEKLVKAGRRVLAIDLRGMGETQTRLLVKDKLNYWGDFKEAFLGLHLNRPLLGQRVYDLITVMNQFRGESPEGFEVIAIGSAGPIALHAAAVENRIKALTLDGSLLSWSLVARAPLSYNQLTNVVPGALEYYDLPDLARLIAPRPLTIKNPVDPVQKPVSQAILDEAYKDARAVYAKQKAEKALVLQAGK